MGKKNKATRREKREQRKREREADEVAQQEAAARRKTTLIMIVLGTLAVSVGSYVAELPSAVTGIALLVGSGLFLAVGLGGLGGSVKPKDSTKSGNIDYGR